MRIPLTAILILFMLASVGQSVQTIEQDLLEKMQKIDHWLDPNHTDNTYNRYDSLGNANREFKKQLIRYVSRYPSTLNYGFKKLQKEGLIITTSPDSLFRIYSWDTWTGGTMHI